MPIYETWPRLVWEEEPEYVPCVAPRRGDSGKTPAVVSPFPSTPLPCHRWRMSFVEGCGTNIGSMLSSPSMTGNIKDLFLLAGGISDQSFAAALDGATRLAKMDDGDGNPRLLRRPWRPLWPQERYDAWFGELDTGHISAWCGWWRRCPLRSPIYRWDLTGGGVGGCRSS
jgi:hypothetical protein